MSGYKQSAWERKRDSVKGSRIKTFGKSQKQVEGEQMASLGNIRFDWGGKIERKEDQQERHLYGCGDPNCDMCNPKDGLGGKAPGGGGDRSSDVRFVFETLGGMGSFSRGGYITSSMSSETPEEREARELDGKLAEARKKVETHLLKTSNDLEWDSVVGNEKARTALLEAIEHPVKHAELYAKYGIPLSKGVLLWGPPGSGKTMFAKAAAAAMARMHGTDVELMVINGPSIQSPYVGETERVIREIFAYARLYAKKHGHQLVVFIDEADAILPSRDGGPMWNASNVATFLTEMDGMESSGAFVILATNRPHALDQALLRDGRCDRKIKVERPDEAAAKVILANTMKGAPLSADMEGAVDRIVEKLFDPMYLLRRIHDNAGGQHHFNLAHIVSGAMVVGLVQRAKGIAFRRELAGEKVDGISFSDFRAAIDEVFQENHGLDHSYALIEFAETITAGVDKRAMSMN